VVISKSCSLAMAASHPIAYHQCLEKVCEHKHAMEGPTSRRVTMLHTRLCDLLGIAFPILSAPMGPDVSGPAVVAAVSNAGSLGPMEAECHPPPLLRQAIRRVRQLTDKPFGVNFLLHVPCDEGVTVCVEERVPVVSFFWGNPASYIAQVHAGG